MSNYTKSTNFATKDALASGNPLKIVKGTEIDTEFNNIATAVNSKVDAYNPTITGQASFADGSATAPSITNDGDSNTGIFFPAADTIAFTKGGVEAMRIDSSGNVGIGTNSPAAKLNVVGDQFIVAAGSGTPQFGIQIKGTALTAVPAAQTQGYIATGDSAIGVAGDLLLAPRTDVAANIRFITGTSPAERCRIDSNGSLMVGTTDSSPNSGIGLKINPSATVPYFATVGSDTTSSNGAYYLYSTGAAAYRFYVGYNGTIFATNTTISAISDQRLKENIRDLDVGLDAVMSLKPRKFDWKEGKGKDIKGDRGWIAQEFEQVFPDLIDEWKDPAPEGEKPYKSIRADLIPVLVKAIQEQQAIIQSLTARIEALEGK